VVRVSEIGRLRLVLQVPESVVPKIRVGDLIGVRVPSLEHRFAGRVARFSNRLQSATRTMETEIDVENPKSELVPGMYAEAVITVDRRLNTLAVPVQAASGDESSAELFVVDNQNRLVQKKVQLGLETADKREILNGLREGELVLIRRVAGLRPGDRVIPLEER
jgi:RND family efflux transporter MFP subunit